ncbi:MAG: DUF4230 domain-containing protein [Actinomycetota bacterium]|nr:DUF4230 domain-containing protein [Actinomycetota bacterium]
MWQQKRRRFPSFITGLVIVVGLVVGAGVLVGNLFDRPFQTTTNDHSPPPVLVDLRDLAEYHAAQAQFEVVIDHEDDVSFMPAALAGERVQFVGVGTVDAVLDFTNIGSGAVVVSDDGTSVTVTLPRPVLATPVLDHDQSHVMNRDRGLFNRIGGLFSDNPTSEDGLYDAAISKMAEAAEATDLGQRAEDNTKLMLYTLFRSLGYERVDIRFPAASTDPAG